MSGGMTLNPDPPEGPTERLVTPDLESQSLQFQQPSINYSETPKLRSSAQGCTSDTEDERTPLLQSSTGTEKQSPVQPPRRMGRGRILKNLIVLSVAYTFVHTSYVSLKNLESSLNLSKGLGVTTLSCVYGGMCFSALYAPLLIRFIGTKYVIAILFVAHALFAAAHFNREFHTLVPAALLVGLISSPATAAQSVYITNIAREYASWTGGGRGGGSSAGRAEPQIALFNGIYRAFFQVTQSTGNLVSSLVLETKKQNRSLAGKTKYSATNLSCGAVFCPGSGDLPSFETPSNHVVNILAGVFIGCCVTGLVLMMLFLDRCWDSEKVAAGSRSVVQDVLGTPLVHFHPWLACFILLFFWSGTEQAFLFSEYTAAFVSCDVGISHVEYAMIGFGVADALGSVCFGRLEKYTGRPILFMFAAVVNVALFLTMLFWKPDNGPKALLYVIPVFWGLADAIWQTLSRALIGTEFPEVQEAAFATLGMWQAAGFTVMFVISKFLCLSVKIYINLAVLILAMTLYFFGEQGIRHRRSRPWRDIY